jgi:hypothetical protein
MNILILGQSNAIRSFDNRASLIAEIQAKTPAMVVNVSSYAVAGTALVAGSVQLWSARGVGTLFQGAVDTANAVGAIDYVVWIQGEADTNNSYPVNNEIYKSTLLTLISDFRALVSGSCIFLIVQIRAGYGNSTDFYFWEKKVAQRNVCNGSDILFAANAEGYPGGETTDFIHWTVDSANKINTQIANTINYFLGLSDYYISPEIIKVSVASDRLSVAMTTSIDIQSGVEFKGFIFKDGGLPVTPSSVTRTSEKVIIATFSSPILDNLLVTFGWYKIQNADCPYVPHSNDSHAFNLLPYYGYERGGLIGKLKYFFSSMAWTKGNGRTNVYTGNFPLYSLSNKYCNFVGFAAGYGHIVDTNGVGLTRFKRSTANTYIFNSDLRIQTYVDFLQTIFVRFIWNNFGNQTQILLGSYVDASNFFRIYLVYNTGWRIEVRYSVAGVLYQCGTAYNATLVVENHEYLLVYQQNTANQLYMYMWDLTTDTAINMGISQIDTIISAINLNAVTQIGTYGSGTAIQGSIRYFGVIPEYLRPDDLYRLLKTEVEKIVINSNPDGTLNNIHMKTKGLTLY